MAGAADWVAQQQRIKVEAQASAAALKNSNDGFDKISKSLRSVTPESERAARALDQMSQRLRTQNSVMGAAIGAAAGAFSYHAAQGLASQASPNGMNSVDKAFSVLSGTIGSLLLPGFVALGAVALMAADSIQGLIDKDLDNIVDGWSDAIEDATKAAKGFSDWWERWQPGGEMAMKTRKALGLGDFGAEGKDPNFPQEQMPDAMKRKFGLIPANGQDPNFPQMKRPAGIEAWDKADLGGGGGGAGGMLGEVAKNMRMIVKDMELSLGPGSHMADPVGMWKTIAMQTANSELDARRMEMQIQALALIRKIADNLEKRAIGAGPPAGGAAIGGRVRRPGP